MSKNLVSLEKIDINNIVFFILGNQYENYYYIYIEKMRLFQEHEQLIACNCLKYAINCSNKLEKRCIVYDYIVSEDHKIEPNLLYSSNEKCIKCFRAFEVNYLKIKITKMIN